MPHRRCNNGALIVVLWPHSENRTLGRFSMWIEKLVDGVVRIITPIGPRYIRLTLAQRAYFLWIFRHFDKLPQQVLSERQQRSSMNYAWSTASSRCPQRWTKLR